MDLNMRYRVYRANIVELWRNGNTVCIPVSLEVRRKDLCGIVDRGSSLAMAQQIPGLAKKLGEFIMIGKGNVGFVHDRVIAFFSKPTECRFERCVPDEVTKYKWGQKIPGGHCMADPVIIERSARQLLRMVIKEHLKDIFLPIPGFDSGQLNVEDVVEALGVLRNSTKVRFISKDDIDDPYVEMHNIDEVLDPKNNTAHVQ